MKPADRSREGQVLERELAAIEEALETGTARESEPGHRELQEIVLALAGDRAEPDPDWREGLDRRVSDGFPRSRSRGSWLPRPALPLLTGACSALAAACVALALALSDTTTTAPSPARPESAASPASDSSAEVGAAETTPAAPQPSLPAPPSPAGEPTIDPGRRTRRVERSASLTLAAPEQRVQRVADEIVQVVDRRRGFVLRSSLDQAGDAGMTVGSFDLRVPARVLPQTIAELSRLASVRARSQTSEDVTRPFASSADRLRTARAERRGLLRRLARARSDERAATIRRQLRRVTRRVSGLEGRARGLRERTTYAAVTVSLVGQEQSGTAAALDDARGSLLMSVNVALRALGVLIPVALVGGLGWLAGAWIRRRRREAVLS